MLQPGRPCIMHEVVLLTDEMGATNCSSSCTCSLACSWPLYPIRLWYPGLGSSNIWLLASLVVQLRWELGQIMPPTALQITSFKECSRLVVFGVKGTSPFMSLSERQLLRNHI